MSTWSQTNFQDANSPLIEELRFLHDYINLILLFIITFVAIIITIILTSSLININFVEAHLIEWFWILIPVRVLIQVAVPRLLILYLIDERADSQITIKSIGHQWYWSYEYRDLYLNGANLSFDSYIVNTRELDEWIFRLLEVDNRVTLPTNTQIRILVSSIDVLHSWTIPSLGVKVDAIPGRINQLKFICQRPGLYFGQCSEICGSNHRFIPIVLEILNQLNDFFPWVTLQAE